MLETASAPVAWAPTGLSTPKPAARGGDGPATIGLIGNFNHSATIDSAQRLIRGPFGRPSNGVRLLFAGLDSDRDPDLRAHAEVLGPVDRVEDFYSQVDAVVVPVTNGAGMKCKLAEAALAGKLVVTTSAGASGYPPSLRKYFVINDDLDNFGPRELLAALEHAPAPERMQRDFEASVGLEAAAERYRRALAGEWGLTEEPPDLTRAPAPPKLR